MKIVDATQQPKAQDGKAALPTGKEQQKARIAALLADWATRWPAVFTTPMPLAIGVARRIKDALGQAGHRDIGAALHHWTNRRPYLRAMARGEMRRNLDGSEAGLPDEAARAYARESLARRARRRAEHRHKRTPRPPAEQG
jgi:sRNA-binding protein